MSSLYLSGSEGPEVLELPDSGSIPPELVAGSLQDFSGSLLRLVPPNGDFIYLQRIEASGVRQNNNGDFIYLQRIEASTIRQNNNGDFIYLQRFAACSDEPKDVIIWLMRARNTANTRYIYWQSPRTPSTNGVDVSTINASSVESVGSIYGPP
jgi:hypothetical protein